jgi:hypothetical protein
MKGQEEHGYRESREGVDQCREQGHYGNEAAREAEQIQDEIAH